MKESKDSTLTHGEKIFKQCFQNKMINLFLLCYMLRDVYNFNLRNKTCFPCLHSLVKTKVNVWENSRVDQWKPKKQSKVFTCSRVLTNFAVIFTRLWRHGKYDLVFLIKILFSVLKKRKAIYEARRHSFIFLSWNCKFLQLRCSQSYRSTSFSCFIGLWKPTCWPIKTQVQSNLFENLETWEK